MFTLPRGGFLSSSARHKVLPPARYTCPFTKKIVILVYQEFRNLIAMSQVNLSMTGFVYFVSTMKKI